MARSSATIAVIDDDESIRKALSRLLRTTGVEVEVFATAEDFLAAASQPPPDCLVLDIRLPGLSGPELHRQLAASGRQAPVVFITAYEDDRVQAEALEAGAAGFFSKPFDDEPFLAAVLSTLGETEGGTVP